jgi:hypothetical protein
MPGSAAGGAFRTVVAALPASSKERLQAALREQAAAEPLQSTAAGSRLGRIRTTEFICSSAQLFI